jgi:hypothetical protein
MNLLVVVNDELFVLKALLLLTCTTSNMTLKIATRPPWFRCISKKGLLRHFKVINLLLLLMMSLLYLRLYYSSFLQLECLQHVF